jgi:hypothetical protein
MLFGKKRFDNAGYHFGLAAECALKELLIRCGIPMGNPVIRKLHFPELREAALQAIEGRGGTRIKQLIGSPSFLQGWAIGMRYARNGSVSEKRADRWRKSANQAISELW